MWDIVDMLPQKQSRIGFTGTREQMTGNQRAALRGLLQLYYGEFHHGDCIGSDEQSNNLVSGEFGQKYVIHVHPPVEHSLRAFCHPPGSCIWPCKPYMERNRDIVEYSDRMFATPKGEEHQRSGTWATIRYARKLGRPIAIIPPTGRIIFERWHDPQT